MLRACALHRPLRARLVNLADAEAFCAFQGFRISKVDKPCSEWSMKDACSSGSECRFMHDGGQQAAAPAAAKLIG